MAKKKKRGHYKRDNAACSGENRDRNSADELQLAINSILSNSHPGAGLDPVVSDLEEEIGSNPEDNTSGRQLNSRSSSEEDKTSSPTNLKKRRAQEVQDKSIRPTGLQETLPTKSLGFNHRNGSADGPSNPANQAPSKHYVYLSSNTGSINNLHRLTVARTLRKAGLLYTEMSSLGPNRIRIICADSGQARAVVDSSSIRDKGWKAEISQSQNVRFGIVRNLDEETTEENFLQDFSSDNGQQILKAKRQQR